jgi:hypothetical protein
MMIQANEKIPMRGIYELRVYRNGNLIEEYRENNHIVNGARHHAAHLFAGDVSGMSIAKIAFGTDGTAPADANTDITDKFEKAVTGFTYPGNGQVRANWKLLTTENNGMAIMEFGLLAADGTLLARIVRKPDKPIHKEDDISVEGSWTFVF